MPGSTPPRRTIGLPVASAAAFVASGTVAVAFHFASLLRDGGLATVLVSHGLWNSIVVALGGKTLTHGQIEIADLPVAPLVLFLGAVSLVTWLGGAAWISRRRQWPYSQALAYWGKFGWLWWLLPLVWELAQIVVDLSGSAVVQGLSVASIPICQSLMWSGWLTSLIVLGRNPNQLRSDGECKRRIPRPVRGAMIFYFACFAAMNWLLYAGLLVPHGDSAMYEEHVWNLLHGKGFRSYLDSGRLFLGEHVQVIHLAVIPLYLIWPSHLLLELCQSACLALGAIPVFRIACRHSGSTRVGVLLAGAYLLYAPMQALDIAVTLKTFRPNSFEIPMLLMALDALERSRYRTFLAWLGLSLLCQEDAATVIAPLGVWIAVRQSQSAGVTDAGLRRRVAWLGVILALSGTAYVIVVVKLILPWFRGGADVHFAQYFSDLGGTSGEIVSTVLTHPGLLLGKLFNVESAAFALALLAPLGFLPLFSPGRLAVAAPLFGVLCLSQITNSPLHHFHAPLVPILIWSAAAGIPRVALVYQQLVRWRRRNSRNADVREDQRRRIPPEKFVPISKSLPGMQEPEPIVSGSARDSSAGSNPILVTAAIWGLLNALISGLPVTMSPLGIGFWDPHSFRFWKNLYVPGERARRFPAALALVPVSSRVASSDYVHPRFTHHDRSYDYSQYRPDVPDDAEFIVIDTRHPYSRIQRPDQVPEFRLHPERWELLDDQTGGYFLVFRRRR